jgi:apolipoprotein N-acyltransferase
VATVDIASSPDPYEEPPAFFQRHAEVVSAAVVFVLTVVLAVLSFPPCKSPEFAYAMLVPGVFWAYLRPRWRTFAWTLLGAQALAWTILLGWLRHVTWPGLLLLGPFIGVWVGCWYLAVWWVMPRIVGRPTMVRLAGVLGLAGAWVLLEWSRTWVLGGFPWLPLAASQWERSSILQIAAFTGAYGTSFVLVMMNLGFAAYAHRLFREGASGFNKRSQEFFLALFLLLVCVCVQFTESFNRRGHAGPLGRVALVQPYIPQEVKWDGARAPGILEVLEKLTMEAAAGRPDLILWPEAVTPLAVRGDAAVKGWLESVVKRAGVPVLLGSVAVEEAGSARERWYNGAFLVTPDGGVAERYYAKRQLVPFGEFVPLRPVLGWLEKVVPVGGDFSAGDSSSPLLVPLRGQFQVAGPLICYEDVYPQLARLSVLGGAGFLTVLTNNGWFGEGGAAYQHAAHAVLRAVETRRPVLRVGNGGWSGWIDEFGVVRATVTDRPEGTIYFRGVRTIDVSRDVRWVDRNSFYVEHGDWFVLGSALMALAAFGLLRTGGSRTPTGDGEPGRMAE